MKLYVTRHGETQYNIEVRICGRTNVKLTEKGIAQARELAESLKNRRIDVILSSPLIRAKQTSIILAETLQIPVHFDERLAERDYGIVDGTYEGTPGFMEQWVQFGYVYPEGESLLKVVQRVYNFMDEIRETYKGKNVLVLGHGGVCRVIHSYFSSLTNEEFFDFHLGNCEVSEYTIAD